MTAQEEVDAYEAEVNDALRTMRERTRYEPSFDETPVGEVIKIEEPDEDEESRAARWETIRETALKLMLWIGAEGGHPATLLKRLVAIGDHMMIEPFCLFNLREKGKILGESHESVRDRMQRICVDPLMRSGARNFKAPGQKGARARKAASLAQQNNQNRRHGHVATANRPSPANQTQKTTSKK